MATRPFSLSFLSLLSAAALGCASGGGAASSGETEAQSRALPLPLAGLAGQTVAVLPATMLLADEELRWDSLIGEHRAALDRADSLIAASLTQRAPEVTWVLPPQLRRSARQAPSLATDPDHLATSVMRDAGMTVLPDPLRSQLRTLVALAGGSRFVVAPAAIFFKRKDGRGTVELHMVMVDARTGQVQWRSVPKADGDDPWALLRSALRQLTPGLP
ncbi:MAG: hypothetical protein ACREN5_09700 [Gemmatimonadales bacterium]